MAFHWRQVSTGAMVAGATAVVAHTLGRVPKYINPSKVTAITVVTATSTTVTFRNDGSTTDTATFILHTPFSVEDDLWATVSGTGWYGGFPSASLPVSGVPALDDTPVWDGAAWVRRDRNSVSPPGGVFSITGGIYISGGQRWGRKGLTAGDLPYLALVTDYLLGVTDCSAARVINLPPAATATVGRAYVVKDESGACSVVNTITVTPNGTEKIDGSPSKILGTAYASVSFYTNGSNWFIW